MVMFAAQVASCELDSLQCYCPIFKQYRATLLYILEHTTEVGIESLCAYTASLQITERQAPIREH